MEDAAIKSRKLGFWHFTANVYAFSTRTHTRAHVGEYGPVRGSVRTYVQEPARTYV